METVILHDRLARGCPELHAFIYKRISDDKTGRAAGVERQHKDTVQWAMDAGATHLHFYEDNDLSASKVDVVRPEYERLVRDIMAGHADGGIVITWAQDRIARQGIESEQLLALFELHRIRFLAPIDGIDMRPEDGALYPRIRAAVAAEEIRKLRVRVNRSLQQNRESGRRHGKIPFGWDASGEPVPEEAAMVVEATERIVRGDSMRMIALDWNSRSLPRPTYTKRKLKGVKLAPDEQFEVTLEWTGGKIRDLVTRASNVGLLVHRGQLLDVEAQWKPLVSLDQWSAVQAYLGQGPRRQHAEKHSRHLLGGLITCGKSDCSSPVYGVTNRSEGHTYLLYRCSRCQQGVNMKLTNDYVTQAVIDFLTAMTFADLTADARRDEVEAAADRLMALRARMQEADDRYADIDRVDAIDASQHMRITAKLKPALAEAEAAVERLTDSRGELLRLMAGPQANTVWAASADDRRRAVISTLATITMVPGPRRGAIEHRIKIAWNRGLLAAAASG